MAEVTGKAHRPSLQQGGGHLLGQNPVCDGHAPLPGPHVHGEQTVDVGGGGHRRLSAGEGGHPPGQLVGAPHVPGEEGDHKPPRLVHTDHGGVGKLVPHMGGNGPHGDPRRPHKYQGVRPRPGPGRPPLQRGVGLRPYLGGEAGRDVEGAPQGVRQAAAQRRPPAGKGDDRRGHLLASRNSWVKVGS